MKRLIIELELTEQEISEPKIYQNLIVFLEKNHSYCFYYQDGENLKQLWINSAKIKEVVELNSQAQILLENKMTKRETRQSVKNH